MYENLPIKAYILMYRCTNDYVMDIRADSGFSMFLSLDQYSKLISIKPKRKVEIPKCWQKVLDYFLVCTVYKRRFISSIIIRLQKKSFIYMNYIHTCRGMFQMVNLIKTIDD